MAKVDDIKLAKIRDDGKAEITVRLYVNKSFSPQFRSGLFIQPQRFLQPERIALDKDGNKRLKARCRSYQIDIPRKGKLNFAEVKELTETDTK